MHRADNQVCCPHCCEWVGYTTKEEEVTTRHLSLGHVVTYQRLNAYCQECQTTLSFIQEIDMENLRRLREAIV